MTRHREVPPSPPGATAPGGDGEDRGFTPRSSRLRNPGTGFSAQSCGQKVLHALTLLAQFLLGGRHALLGEIVELEVLHDLPLALAAGHGVAVDDALLDAIA